MEPKELTVTKEQLDGWYQNRSQKDIMQEADEREEDDLIFDNGSRFEILEDEYIDRREDDDVEYYHDEDGELHERQ